MLITVDYREPTAIALWDVATGQSLQFLENAHADWVWFLTFHPREPRFASSSRDGSIKLWNSETGDCYQTLTGHAQDVKAIAISSDGALLASGGFDGTVRPWDWPTGTCRQILRGRTQFVWSVLFSPDGTRLFSNSDDQTTRIWQVATGRLLRTVQERTSRVWSLALSPPGEALAGTPTSSIVASSSEDQVVRLWDSATGQTLKTLWSYSSVLWAIASAPDGRYWASSSDQGVQLWDVQTLCGHTNRIWSVAYSPEGTCLASCREDQTLRLWNLATGQC